MQHSNWEELRNNIVNQVKQSEIINQYVSEDMKPRQLSDAIFQELGRKIMGQISDEIWQVIRSNDCIKDDIRATVESVFNKMTGGEPQGKGANPSPAQENLIVGMEANVTNALISNPIIKANMLNSNEINDPSGIASSGHPVDENKNFELMEHEQRPCLLLQNSPKSFVQCKVLTSGVLSSQVGGEADDESDLPPGFD